MLVAQKKKKSKEWLLKMWHKRSHWVRTFRAPKYMVDLYQKSQKKKEKDVETNFIFDEAGPSFNGLCDDTHLDVSDFIVDPEVS